jgi:hypothetical protein
MQRKKRIEKVIAVEGEDEGYKDQSISAKTKLRIGAT